MIGVEFASVWKSFGAEVNIVEALPRLVPLEDEALSKQLERAFRKRKINFTTGVKFSGVTQDDSGVTVSLENGNTLEADLLLVAVGRGPRSAGLGYEEVGVTVDRGLVTTDERLHTNRRRRLRRRRPGARPAARAPRLRPRHLRRRGDRRARARADRRLRASRGSPTATPRSPRSASPRRRPRRSTARTTSSPTSTTSAATARARS